MAAFNAFVHRMLAIPLEQKDRVEDTNIIKSIAVANGYNGEIVDKLVRKHSVKINSKSRLTDTAKKDTKFVVTEYTNVLPVIVKNELKKHKITVAFKTTNNIKKRLGQRTHIPDEEKTGVYKQMCIRDRPSPTTH